VPAKSILGNVALVSQYTGPKKTQEAVDGYRFTDWELEGEAFTISPDHAFGPLLWSMYTLSDSRSDRGFIMKMSGSYRAAWQRRQPVVELQIKQDGAWKSLGEATWTLMPGSPHLPFQTGQRSWPLNTGWSISKHTKMVLSPETNGVGSSSQIPLVVHCGLER